MPPGRLKIFFGAGPGVGKTYRMLQAARTQQASGRRVMAVAVQTHGSAGTARLLTGLEALPAGAEQASAALDLDAILQRRPALLVVDELARHNPAGTRYRHRWQDVEALLAAGIDVYTTLDLQQLDSLNDAVKQITGARAVETVPDRLFDRADEVEWVNPPSEGNPVDGTSSPFRPGTLLALRELGLKRIASRPALDAPPPTRIASRIRPRLAARTVARFEPLGMVWRYAAASVAAAATTALALALARLLDPANLIMLYLLAVVGVAMQLGRGPAVLTSLLSVAAFDFFLVPPHYSLSVADTQYLLTFAIMLAVALVISNLTANLRYQADLARQRERRAAALFALSKALSAALTEAQVAEIATRHLHEVFQARTALLLPDASERLSTVLTDVDDHHALTEPDLIIAQRCYDDPDAALPTDADTIQYLLLRAPMRVRGVLAIAMDDDLRLAQPELRQLLDTFTAQIAQALERVHYVEVAQDALVAMESERLRNTLLSALSHDLRTPLTAIVGLSSTLAGPQPLAPDTRRELVDGVQEEALRMSGLISNLLDMARLHAGGVTLNRDWQMLEEVVGSALQAEAYRLGDRPVDLALPPLPLLEFDAVLIERVLCNLLENAAKYTPSDCRIGIGASVAGDEVRIWVEDAGPGLPPSMQERIFDKFTRGDPESAQPGVGLGLAICRAIVEAHGGRIRAKSPPEGGVRFVFTLPQGQPPATDEDAPAFDDSEP